MSKPRYRQDRFIVTFDLEDEIPPSDGICRLPRLMSEVEADRVSVRNVDASFPLPGRTTQGDAAASVTFGRSGDDNHLGGTDPQRAPPRRTGPPLTLLPVVVVVVVAVELLCEAVKREVDRLVRSCDDAEGAGSHERRRRRRRRCRGCLEAGDVDDGDRRVEDDRGIARHTTQIGHCREEIKPSARSSDRETLRAITYLGGSTGPLGDPCPLLNSSAPAPPPAVPHTLVHSF